MGKVYLFTAEEGLKNNAEVWKALRCAMLGIRWEKLLKGCHSSRYILENQESIATIACLDSGKTRIDASLGEILVTVEKLKWTIQHGEKALKAERRPTNFLMMYKHNEVRWEPLGVVAACVSWK